MFYIILLIASLLPQISQAATTGSLQSLLSGIGGVLNNILIPFIIALAFLFFIINVVRFFIIKGHDPEGQKNARYLAFYSIATFVFIFSFWGIINFLIGGFGLNNDPCLNDTTSDYVTSDLAPCTSPIPPTSPIQQPQKESDLSPQGDWSSSGGVDNKNNKFLLDSYSLQMLEFIKKKEDEKKSLLDIKK